MKFRFLAVFGLFLAALASASIDVYQFDSPTQEQRFRQLIQDLRCPKCQNESLAGSDAAVAKDLKDRAYRLMKEGKSDDEIRAYLIERYGDFISYRPPVRPGTLLLWLGPLLLLLLTGLVVVWRVRRPAAPAAPLTEEEQRRLSQLLDDTNHKT